MLAIDLVRVMLGFGALTLAIIGTCIVFDPLPASKPAPEKGNYWLLISIIALILMFNI